MYCDKCGSHIAENDVFCNNCGAKIEKIPDINNKQVSMDKENVKVSEIKEFELRSTIGIKFLEMFRKRVTKVKISNGVMELDVIPEKYNALPKIYIDDIADIRMKTKIGNYYLYLTALVTVIGVFSLQLYFGIAALLLLWAGRNSEVTITLKNGMEADIYVAFKRDAMEFVNYLRDITNIQEK